MSHTELEGGVDVVAGSNSFLEVHDCFVEEGHEEGVGNEAGNVLGDGDGLAACYGKGAGAFEGVGRGLEGGDELDEFLKGLGRVSASAVETGGIY